MSKPIKITETEIEEIRKLFENALSKARLYNGSFQFQRSFVSNAKTATVWFTYDAWSKMSALIKEFSSEVAWHGVCQRGQVEGEYVISDILVYPQTVSGATVEMDEEKYSQWLIENIEDPRFEHIRMQGHSHVNMATSPSQTDLKHQEDILEQIPDDGFYIFMIWNKKGECTNRIYDMAENVMYENKEISVKVIGGCDTKEFIESAKKVVVQYRAQTAPYYGGNYTGQYYGGGYQQPTQNTSSAHTAEKPISRANTWASQYVSAYEDDDYVS